MEVNEYQAGGSAFQNPLDKYKEEFAKVRVFWGIIGTVIGLLGFELPFIAEDLFTTATYDQILSTVIGIVGSTIALYQMIRKAKNPDEVVTQTQLEKRSVTWSPFGRYGIR